MRRRWWLWGLAPVLTLLVLALISVTGQDNTTPRTEPARSSDAAASARNSSPARSSATPAAGSAAAAPAAPPPAPPSTVARAFVTALLGCELHRAPCQAIAGVYPPYKQLLVSTFADAPVTGADLTAKVRLLSLRVNPHAGCPDWLTAAALEDENGKRLTLHVELAREAAGWQVFGVDELPVQLPDFHRPGADPARCEA